MAKRKITEKHWAVLEHFILGESKKIEETLQKYNKVTSENLDHFFTYPSEIESKGIANRVTAGEACEQFSDEKMSYILKISKDYKRKQGSDSKFYSLNTDLPAIRKLVKLILESHPYYKAKKLLDNYYFTYNLNESLIREVLYEKGVTISRLISVMDLDINDAQHIKDLFERNTGNKINSQDEKGISSIVKESVEKYEINNKRTESSYINKLKSFCDHFYEDLNSLNSDETEYYFRDFDLYSISRSRCCDYETYSAWSTLSFIKPIFPFNLKLPVFSDKVSEIEKIEKIKELNIETFYRMCYGETPKYVIDFWSFSIKETHSIISWLYNFQNMFWLDYQNDLDLFDKLKNLLYNFADQLYYKYYKCCAHFNFNELEKDINELQKQVNEYLNQIKEKNISKEEKGFGNTIDREISHINLQFEEIHKKFDKCKNIKKLNNGYIQNNFNSVLQEHYSIFEYNKLILPILVLIQSSPLALNEFLNGKWDSFDLSFDLSVVYTQNVRNSKFLTKLIHMAFIDLMSLPNILFEKGIVESISFNPYCPPGVNHFENIEVKNRNEIEEHINNSLDECYDEISYDQLRIIEGTPLRITLKNLYELTFYLSFIMNAKGNNQNISSSLSINIIPNVEVSLFRAKELKDTNSLVSKLQKKDSTIYDHIRKLLSNRMQNIILHYDTSLQPSIRLKQELLKELNLIVLKPELCSKGAFKELTKSDDELRDLIEMTVDLSFKDLIQMVHKSCTYGLDTKIRHNNKYILKKIFRDEFRLNEYANIC